MSGRTFGVQSLRWFGRPVVGVALWRWPGPEVLLSLLPGKVDYTHKGLKSSKNLSANQASTPLVQVTPTLKSRRVLGAFRVLQGCSFQCFQLINQH